MDKASVEEIINNNLAIIGTDSDRIHLKSMVSRFTTEMAAAFAIANNIAGHLNRKASVEEVLNVFDRLHPPLNSQ